MKENRCVCCGEIIPEGRQVCINCEHKKGGNVTSATRDESLAIKKYIKYVTLRVAYMKADVICVENENEYRYYATLLERIKDWGSKHIIVYKIITKNLDYRIAMKYLGIEQERRYFKFTTEQRKDLKNSILRWEEELLQKYPFDLGTNHNHINYGD